MKTLVLIGQGHALEQAQRTAQACGLDHVVIELESPDRYNFDLGPLHASHAPSTTNVFVAMDERAVNQSRHKLLADVRLAGYGSVDLVWPQSHVDDGVRLLGNVHVGPGCNLAAGSSIGAGSWLERQVIVEQDVRVGACVTLHAGVHLGRGTQIGQGSTLGGGSMTRSDAKIGRHCEWLLPGTVPDLLADRCFYDALMPGGARILR
ncbi:acetyltransferase [Xanthomonas sacchari]|uniref:Acetyltransferase n=1 Tax=Xanthomonas sacchari TaxID=56458 RepID=A0A2P5Z5A2_9XANT|nr:acetyltransferase [Xanthomonas sacchari]MDV0438160.1 acetyltransferase [Xanthomonas sacchari]PPU83168.1 acetyltransferase [Xanthomonas sacchari]